MRLLEAREFVSRFYRFGIRMLQHMWRENLCERRQLNKVILTRCCRKEEDVLISSMSFIKTCRTQGFFFPLLTEIVRISEMRKNPRRLNSALKLEGQQDLQEHGFFAFYCIAKCENQWIDENTKIENEIPGKLSCFPVLRREKLLKCSIFASNASVFLKEEKKNRFIMQNDRKIVHIACGIKASTHWIIIF